MPSNSKHDQSGPCTECGDRYKDDYSGEVADMMDARQLCFDCAFWTVQIEKNRSRVLVVDGEQYSYGRESDPFPGFGGRRFVFRRHSGEIIESGNVWHQGKIPERFRDRLPDDAVIVPPDRSPDTQNGGQEA